MLADDEQKQGVTSTCDKDWDGFVKSKPCYERDLDVYYDQAKYKWVPEKVLNQMRKMNCDEIFNYTKHAGRFESDVVYLTQQQQANVLHLKELECRCRMETEPVTLTGRYCNRTWDNVMCWNDTPAGTVANQPCPSYINHFKRYNFATRICLENGTWFSLNTPARKMKGWTNFTACPNNITVTANEFTENVPQIFAKHVQDLRLMYNIGYALSLVSLLIAFTIMIYFKKLHCSRNTIHLNLFASFMFRAAMSLIRDNFMVAGLGFPKDVTYNETGGIVTFNDGSHWECRLFFSIFQYAIAASYIWIFVEAIYLHMYIFMSVFKERFKIWWFILFGWSFPVIIIVCLCIARYHLDNTFCWNTHNEEGLVWIFKGPIMLTILLNFFFFINMIRVLYIKLQEPHGSDSTRSRHRRLAGSTLFLIPTFGVYFIIFTLPLHSLSDTWSFVMLFIEMFFNSFQGLFIAVVLCFKNSEVRTEIKRSCRQGTWTFIPCNENLSNRYRKNSTQSRPMSRNVKSVTVETQELQNMHDSRNYYTERKSDQVNAPFLENT